MAERNVLHKENRENRETMMKRLADDATMRKEPGWKAMLSASPRTGDLWCHGTRYVRVRNAYGTPEAGTRTAYVQCVGPRSKLPCASGTTARGRLVRV